MRYILLTLLSLLFFMSCTKEVDFDQVNDITITPTVETSLFYFTAQANEFFEDEDDVVNFIEVDIFNDASVNHKLTRLDLVFETENTIPRDFSFTIEFYNESSVFINSFTFLTSEESPHIITFEEESLEQIKNSNDLVFTLKMLPGTPINSNTSGNINLKSKGIFYLNIES